MKDGVRIQARAWVGLIRFDSFDVRIVPKLAGDAVGLVKMLAFTRGIEGLRRYVGHVPIEVRPAADLVDLLGILLAYECERIVRVGLLSAYVEREEAISFVRGRVLINDQLRMGRGLLTRVHCRYDEFERDIDDNRLLAAAISVASRRVEHAPTRRRLSALSEVFTEVCSVDALDLAIVRDAIVYDRRNAHYKTGHALALLLLRGFGVKELLGMEANSTSFAFLLDMNELFEEFVGMLISRLYRLPAYLVSMQRSDQTVLWDLTANAPFQRVRPDVLIERQSVPQARIAVDAKYKLYEDKGVAGSDVYQAMLYANAYGGGGQDLPRCVLAYPSTSGSAASATVQLRGPAARRVSEVAIVGVAIPEVLDAIERGTASPSMTCIADAVDTALGKAT